MADDISPDVIKKTQKILGKYVKKPALTEKLLKKPPFRFLHDIVISVIKETGFLKGLFSADEFMPENVKEKEAKVAFLNKLIEAVKTVTKADLAVRASKIVAGLEPTKTNLLLQAIGKAIDNKIDASEYIAQLNSGQIETEKKKVKKLIPKKDEKGKTPKTKSKDDSSNKPTKTKKISDSPRNKTKASTPKDSSREKNNKLDKTGKSNSIKNVISEEVSKKEEVEVTSPKENMTVNNSTDGDHLTDTGHNQMSNISDDLTIKVQDQSNEKEHVKVRENSSKFTKTPDIANNSNVTNEEQENANNLEIKQIKNDTETIIRPKSARPKKEVGIKQKNVDIDQEETLKPLQIIANPPQRPKSSLRPPSVRPSSARPGAPRLRPDSALPLQETVTMGNINVIVENVDNMDDEETVVIQTTSEISEENLNSVEVPKDNKGQLVEQILEQIQEEGEGLKKKVDIDWEQDALHNKDGATREVNQLRSLIQTLTRTANPLGKLMNYLHEDIDAMHGELQMWTNIKNQLFKEIYKQKRLSIESNKPLLAQLEHIQEEIKKQQQEVITARSNILRNELRIKELLNV